MVHPGFGSRILILIFYSTQIQGSKPHRIPDPDPQHCPKIKELTSKCFAFLCKYYSPGVLPTNNKMAAHDRNIFRKPLRINCTALYLTSNKLYIFKGDIIVYSLIFGGYRYYKSHNAPGTFSPCDNWSLPWSIVTDDPSPRRT
jgi:hypothetical protein